MMMPVLDQSPAHHHHHGHGHQTFYHQQHIPEQSGKMQLTLILPNGVPSVISVDASTPMMDLLVQAASLNKLNPSGYSLVVLDSNQHVIHFKANQTVGQIVRNCQLPQINGSSTISLLPKEASHPNLAAKPKAQPFEITVRLQINLPDTQKILIRVDPTLPLHEIKEQICKQKKYTDSSRYTLRLPSKLDQPLLLGLSLAEYKTNELTLVRLKQDPTLRPNQIQSFDRLYRVRSESQPPQETNPTIPNEQQESVVPKQRPASVQLNPSRSPAKSLNVTSLPARSAHQVTSHTSLHAYWNDPNFDTQSQTSNCSSTTKKRRAPQPPGYVSPTYNDQAILLPQLSDHRESQESLTETINGIKQKRQAPAVPTTTVSAEIHPDEQQTTTKTDVETTVTTLEEQPATSKTETVQTAQSSEQTVPEPHPATPIYSQIQKTQEITHVEPPYSTVKSTPTPPVSQQEQASTNYSVETITQAGIARPPSVSPVKPAKKSASTDGLVKIINDHTERAQVYQSNEKLAEENSYFRVAKSRHGKFETESQGFINNSSDIFEQPSIPAIGQKPNDEHSQIITISNNKEKSPTPIQLEVTERTTHISVTVESDRKQLITRASPIPPSTTSASPPPIVAPKPSGKTITEYRTIRRTGADGETTTTTTVRTETVPPTDADQQPSTATDTVGPTNSNNDTVTQQADGSSK